MGGNIRIAVVGRNSAVWRAIEDMGLKPAEPCLALGHADIAGARLDPSDIVWILSYAASDDGNRALLENLRAAGARKVIYVSTATALVAEKTRCYRYPRVKLAAEEMARAILNATICRIGVTYRAPADLPGGLVAATSYATLAGAMERSRELSFASPDPWRLYELVQRPFRSSFEALLFRLYGVAMSVAGRWPCLLRPVDLGLKLLGYGWYGYVFLGNRLCALTTSSSAQG